ncbi:MAG: hypothetical protein NC412_12615 [Roseburia sp.]|nr:hypothetical protein [Roseburia sp.]
MCDYSQGIADSYWFEWMVGLLYALDMLNPDNQICHIIFQASDLQGLDDVVVCYENKKSLCIQVKHTRENNNLTFNNMIEKDECKGKHKLSYLRQFATDWQRAKNNDSYGECAAILFTNRKMGKRKSTLRKMDIHLPALEDFWKNYKPQIDNVNSLDDIVVAPEDEKAWSLWMEELEFLNAEERLCFLKQFDIYANQEDLEELVDKIQEKLVRQFNTSTRISMQLMYRLCFALMKWTTTIRNKDEVTKEELTKEELFEALSLNSDGLIGEHDFSACEPFFQSRIDFITDVEREITSGEKKVYFMSGDPGSGKTNIVNYMANKGNSIITCRFHAFKPLDVQEVYMSADEGISDPRALWGNLLIMLRENEGLKGKLGKYAVPVTIDLIDSIDVLRREVLRIAAALADETGKKTVIAIDGIDHAARTGKKNTFLSTLLPPDAIPDNVVFLIVGQPVNQYKDYPLWLSDNKVGKFFVPKLDERDVLQLYDNLGICFPRELKKHIIDLVCGMTDGNTLSVIYSLYEVQKCVNIEDAESVLIEKKLNQGVNAYYKYMWEGATVNIGIVDAGKILAGTISQLNVRITPDMLEEITGGKVNNEGIWRNALNSLYPLIVCTGETYGAFHNDFKIFLEKYLQSDVNMFRYISRKLADYVRYKNVDKRLKHESIFNLLKNADCRSECAKLLDAEYVCEAISLKRPMIEIQEQINEVIDAFWDGEVDLKYIINLSSAVSTLEKFQESLYWVSEKYEDKDECLRALWSEKNKVKMGKHNLDAVFADIENLISSGKFQRAKIVYDKWLHPYLPEDICVELFGDEKKEGFDENRQNVFIKWGEIAYKLDKAVSKNVNIDSETGKVARANWIKGFIKEASKEVTLEGMQKAIDIASYYYPEDFKNYFTHIVVTGADKCTIKLCEERESKLLFKTNKLYIMVWALCSRQQNICEDWITEVEEEGFCYADEGGERMLQSILISFVLIARGKNDQDVYEHCKAIIEVGDNGDWVKHNLLVNTVICSLVCKAINKNAFEKIQLDDYMACLDNLFGATGKAFIKNLGGEEYEKFLIKNLVNMTYYLPKHFNNSLEEFLGRQPRKSLIGIEVIWDYWRKKGEIDKLFEIYDLWMRPDGMVWNMDLSDLIFSVDFFIAKAEEIGWIEKAEAAKRMKDSKMIGYSGSKEYSMGILQKWYEGLDGRNAVDWQQEGIKLLNISQYASDTGDNRYEVFVDNAIAVSAGKKGASELWKMANINDIWDKQWVQVVYDGVIGAMEKCNFEKEELLEIWKYATKIFHIDLNCSQYDYNNNINKIYIFELKEAIKRVCDRLGYESLFEEMEREAKQEYHYEMEEFLYGLYKIPDRWFEDEIVVETEIVEPNEVFLYVQDNFEGKYSSDIWNWLVKVLQKVKYMGRNVAEYIPNILELVKLKRTDCYSWEDDGIYRLYDCLAAYMNQGQYQALLNDIFKENDAYKQKYKREDIYPLSLNLEYFTYDYYVSLSKIESRDAFNKLLDMHLLWITGSGNVQVQEKYREKDLQMIENWKQFSKLVYEKWETEMMG